MRIWFVEGCYEILSSLPSKTVESQSSSTHWSRMRCCSIVAFFGVAGALLTLFIERSREFGIYRALGFSSGQVARMTLIEGLEMGLVSFILSTAVGTVLAFLLIKVINLRGFNWTIFYFPAWQPYILTGITAILASLGAGAYPIWRVFRVYPQIQIC